MKDKLAGYVASFANHKKELHLLLTSQSSLKVNDIQTDVRTILSLVKTKSATEQKADEVIQSLGGLKAVLNVRVSLLKNQAYALTVPPERR